MAAVLMVAVLISLAGSVKCQRNLIPDGTNDLPHSTILDPSGKFTLFWDFDAEKIIFEVQVATLGYFGVGFSQNGAMTGSDIVTGGVDNNGTVYLKDRYASGNFEPSADVKQDWTVIFGYENGTHTIVRFYRKLNTCDMDDVDIKEETVRVIWAYSDNDWEQTTQRYHHGNRGSKSLFLMNQQRTLPKLPANSFTVDFLNTRVKQSSVRTQYRCKSFAVPSLPSKHHAIKFEPIIAPGNERIVHHIVLYSCPPGIKSRTVGLYYDCFGDEMPKEWWECTTTIFAWAVGGGPFSLPEHVGYPFGFDEDPPLLILETHFDNLEEIPIYDTSGIRMTLTPTLRMHDAGTLVVGAFPYRTHIIPPYAESFRTDGHCTPRCLNEGFGNVPEINIFATLLHSHLLSTAIKLRHIRGGIEHKPIAVDGHYDFNFQETRVVVPEIRVGKGDHLVTECYYRTTHKETPTYGGLSTDEEMCESFALYYPRVPLSSCYSRLQGQTIGKMVNVETYGLDNFTVFRPPHLEGTKVGFVIFNVTDWTNKTAREHALKESTSYENPVMQLCNKYSDRAGTAKGFSIRPPRILKEYEENSTCEDDLHLLPSGTRTIKPLNAMLAFVVMIMFIGRVQY